MSEILVRAEGENGQLELTETVVRIRRQGLMAFLTQGLAGDKEILVTQISSVQFKAAGFLSGYIQFAFLGGLEAQGGLGEGTWDENTVTFNQSQQAAFEEFRDEVMRRIAQAKASASAGGTVSAATEIERLATLRDRRVITEEDFQAAKKKLLGL